MLRNISKSSLFKTSFKQFYSFSYYKNLDLNCPYPSFQSRDLTVTHTMHYITKPPCDPKIMTFGAFHTDHLLEIDWSEKMGWSRPQIVPFKSFSVHPFAACLHYAIECFEGAKAYRGPNNSIRTFRLNCNMYRMKQSAKRLSLPDFDGAELERCIEQLLKVDRDWIPDRQGFSCYIRPTLIATEEALGVRASSRAKLFVVLCPVGPYFPSGLKPVRVFCNTSTIRSAPGGVGGFKVAGNYAPTVLPLKEVQKIGFHQNLWMLPDGLVQEMGVCNLFFFQKNQQGEKELVTPILDGTILPGIMRDSILEITRGMGKFKVIEKKLYIQEVIESIESGRMIEMFGSGTAVSIQPIEAIGYDDKIYEIKYDTKLNAGELSQELFDLLTKIQTGGEEHKWIKSI
ncbi:unnamed protein product [Paramecium sonneborni]|uniref:Branched-chain-amino-acid aminotransferase n=1 Tax=Paramecium sonneborni TaxID=65129 RepID=A0A8S1MMW2_9CILI|nr:unnamed protein product [Paramecium sonneborni]